MRKVRGETFRHKFLNKSERNVGRTTLEEGLESTARTTSVPTSSRCSTAFGTCQLSQMFRCPPRASVLRVRALLVIWVAEVAVQS